MQNEHEQHCNKFNIFVNAKRNSWNDKTITYSQVVDLAFPPPRGTNEMFLVHYSRGQRENRDGTLVNGQETEVKNDMVCDVTRTDKS